MSIISLCYRRQPEAKFRNDENVLGGVTAEYRQITTGQAECGEFVTDLGLVVPCVNLALRERLQAVIVNHGLGMVVMWFLLLRNILPSRCGEAG